MTYSKILEKRNVERSLREMKDLISNQTYKTVLGQIRAGDLKGATKGIERLRSSVK